MRKPIDCRDAYACGHLFALCNRLGAGPKPLPYTGRLEIKDVGDRFANGGPLPNEFVAICL